MTQPADDPVLEPDEPDTAPDSPDPDEPTGEPEPEHVDDAADPARRARAEAKNLRARVRALEQERDQLATAVERYRRAEAEVLAGEHLAAGSDLWVGGVSVAELLDDEGVIDAAKVSEAASRVVAARPHWARSRGPRPDRSQGSTSKDSTGDARRTWESLVRGR